MPKLFAIAALIMVTFGAATAQTSDMPNPGVAPPPSGSSPSPQLDPQKKMWFDHAVGHILGSDA